MSTKPKLRKLTSKPAVVTITEKTDGATYAQILSKAKQNVSLGNLGIENVRMRRGMNGALIIELPGPDGKRLASTLSSTLRNVLKEDAKVSNPVAMGEVRIRGIDPTTTAEEIGYALEKIGNCLPNELTISKINYMRDGMGVAWARCPLEYAIKIAEKGSYTWMDGSSPRADEKKANSMFPLLEIWPC